MTDYERELAEAKREAYHQGYREAQQAAQRLAEAQVQQLRDRITQLEEAGKPPRRMTNDRGHQVVQIGGYAYAWSGVEPLSVGDDVVVPENYVSRVRHGPGAYTDTVTDLGTDYTGELAYVVRRT